MEKKSTKHELNNQLANLHLSAELLLKEIPGKLNAEQKKYIKAIVDASKKVQELVKKMPL